MSKLRLGTVISLISGTAFATLAIFAKWAYAGGANVPSVLFLRFSGAAILFWLYYLIKAEDIRYERNTIIKLILMGAMGYGSMSALFLLAVSRIPASLAAMFLYFHPALVTLVTIALRIESFNLQKGIALCVTFAGMVLVLGVSFQSADLLGILCGLGAAVVYTVYITAGSQVLKSLEPLKATMYIMTGGALAYGLFGLFMGNLAFDFSSAAWFAIGGIILVATILAVGCFWLGVKLIGPSKTTIISTVEPLATVVLAWYFFNEVLTGQQLFGGMLIILGVLILQYPAEKDKNEEASFLHTSD